MGEGPGALLSFKHSFLSLTDCWWLYNIQLKTIREVLFLPPSDAYVRSFLYLFYTLIKLYYTKALSDQASSLAPGWIHLLWRPRIPACFMVQQQPFTLPSMWELPRMPQRLSGLLPTAGLIPGYLNPDHQTCRSRGSLAPFFQVSDCLLLDFFPLNLSTLL